MSRKRSARNAGCRGLTLLELLVAAALAVGIITAVAVLSGRGLVAFSRTQGRLKQLFLMEKGLNQMGRELRNGVAVGFQERPFVGTKEQLDFFTSLDPTHLVKVTYRLRAQGQRQALVRESQPVESTGEAEVKRQTLIPGVTGFAAQCGAADSEEGTTIQWIESWNQSEHLPQLLRVQIQTQDPQGGIYSMSREFLIPQGVLASPTEGEGIR